MLVTTKNTCRPAWPNSGTCASAWNVAAMNTENSRTLPMIPTGQAHTRRRSPPTAEANPNPLPRISRQVIGCPAMVTWASYSEESSELAADVPAEPQPAHEHRLDGRLPA